jgi:catabolite repression protein CreC
MAELGVEFWRFTDFVFFPDVKYVAAISEDCCLHVIDALAEQYAVLFCVCVAGIEHQACRLLRCLFRVTDMFGVVTRWPLYYRESPSISRGFLRLTASSGKTGGQDDLVNIFSPWERVIARCQGPVFFVCPYF